jgi:hypothetical protein
MAKIALSSTISAIRGKVGTNVYTRGRSGPTLRIKVPVANPKTQPQRFVRGNLGRAARAYKSLTKSQRVQWQDYAAGLQVSNKVTGNSYSPAAIDVFVGLAAKFLQVSPTGTIPLTPPSTPFSGDNVVLTATTPSAGIVRLTASGPNTAGVTTEILIQRLPSINRMPPDNGYRHKQFHVFAGATPLELELGPGVWAVAYRFVKTSTGQATDPLALPVQQVALELMDDQPMAA